MLYILYIKLQEICEKVPNMHQWVRCSAKPHRQRHDLLCSSTKLSTCTNIVMTKKVPDFNCVLVR
jgi:hypothetical protein